MWRCQQYSLTICFHPHCSFDAFDFAYRVIKAHELDLEKEAASGKPHEAKMDTQLGVVRRFGGG